LVLLKWLLWVHAGKLNSASLKVQYFPVCKGQRYPDFRPLHSPAARQRPRLFIPMNIVEQL